MDPLSTIASDIATIQATGATAKGIEKLWGLRHASRDFVILKNEVLDPFSTA
jgi:hypothetical protein